MQTNHDLESIFSQAIELVDPQHRGDFIDRACEGNVGLKNRVSSLIAANRRANNFMNEPAGILELPDDLDPATLDMEAIGEQPGDRVGRYELLEQIGEGGMGWVFRAEQQEPVQRQVALKVVKPGLDTKEVIARFESERQALALMSHANIANVLDAGATVLGRPYFVMELVEGTPVTTYCNEANLDTRQRLELFIPICRAIQHAHQKGIIHRDIKPRNVLITQVDGKPVPKVIDFGIAKATDQRLTEKTLFTLHGQFIGTPGYMSPEQADDSGIDVDTRSDVYSLGALLYEMLTGVPPVDADRFKTMNHSEMRRVIREETPTQPSDAAGGALQSQLRGELDWIVMRTLEKERDRRYDSATALADDIQRYLNNEAVVARPQTASYRLRKFLARNRLAVMATIAIATTLMAATIFSGWMAINSIASEKEATTERESLSQVVDFLRNGLLANADPTRELDRNVKLRTVLDRAATRLSSNPIREPRVEMAVRTTIGETYRGLGELDQAIGHFERAHELGVAQFGPDDPKSLAAANDVVATLISQARYGRAKEILKETLRLAKKKLAPSDEILLTSRKLEATRLQLSGDLLLAEEMFRDVLAIRRTSYGDSAPETFVAMSDLASVYQSQQRFDESLELMHEAHNGMMAAEGEWHPATLKTSHFLARLHLARHETAEAQAIYEETLTTAQRLFGPDHPQTLSAKHGVALVYASQDRLGEAITMLGDVLERQKEKLGTSHPATLDTMHNLAEFQLRSGDDESAESLMLGELAGRQQAEGTSTRGVLSTLAFFYLERQNYDQAVECYVDLLAQLENEKADNADTWAARTMLALCQHKSGHSELAKPELEEVRDRFAGTSPNTWPQFVAESLLGEVELAIGNRSAAEKALLGSYEGLKLTESDVPAHWKPMGLRAATRRLVEFYDSADTEEDRLLAAPYREELKSLRRGNSQPTTPELEQTGNTQDGNPN